MFLYFPLVRSSFISSVALISRLRFPLVVLAFLKIKKENKVKIDTPHFELANVDGDLFRIYIVLSATCR